MRRSFEAAIICDQDLSAPDMPVCAVASAVQSEADDFALDVVLRHTTRDMRMMVLYPDKLCPALLERPCCRKIIGMEIVGNDFRLDFQNSFEMVDGLAEKVVTLSVFQITDVLA